MFRKLLIKIFSSYIESEIDNRVNKLREEVYFKERLRARKDYDDMARANQANLNKIFELEQQLANSKGELSPAQKSRVAVADTLAHMNVVHLISD